jgi:hypothetical protein
MKPWRVYRPMAADSYHDEEEEDPDPNEKLDLDQHQ